MTLLLEPVPVPLSSGQPGYDVEITPEVVDGEVVYMARHPELPGCVSDGSTPDEAKANLDDARAMYLAALDESGYPTPEPHDSPRVFKSTIYASEVQSEEPAPRWRVLVAGGNELDLAPDADRTTTTR